MFDSLLMLRDGATDGSLTTTGTTDGVEIQESPVRGLTFIAIVPAAAATTTLDIEIQSADTDADGSYATIISFPQITAAGIHNIHVAVKERYVRGKYSVAGTTPDFGAVTVVISPSPGRFWNA